MWASKLALYTRVAMLNRSCPLPYCMTPPCCQTNAGSNSDILTLATPGFCSFLISCTNLFVQGYQSSIFATEWALDECRLEA